MYVKGWIGGTEVTAAIPGLMVWVADNEVGEPVCISTSIGFSVTLYRSADNEVTGVVVHSEDGALVSATGTVLRSY